MAPGILPIFLIVLVDILGLTIILPLLPFYAERFGASPLLVGLLTSTYAICQLFSGPILGQWSDRVGRKPLLLLSQFGTFCGFILLACAGSLRLIFLSRVIDGLTAGNISLAQAHIADVTQPKDRAKAFGLIGMAFGIGFFLGPAITGVFYQFGYRFPIYIAAGLSATSMLATAILLPKAKPMTAGGGGPKLLAIASFRRYLQRPLLLSLLIQMFLFCFEFSAYVSGFALFAERRFTLHGLPLDARQVGYAFAYFGMIGIILQGMLMGRLVARFGEKRLVRLGFAACALGYVVLGVSYHPAWIVLTGLFTGFGNGVIRPALTSEITQAVERHEAGAVLGLNQSLNSVAQILAPIAAGTLINLHLLTLWSWAPASLCLLALVLIARQRPRPTSVGN
jgi:DHA1 family tetracycline resistance protein-like MFS transporter